MAISHQSVIEGPVKCLFFVVSMVFYVYAVPLQGMGRNNGKGAEVATSCSVDSRMILQNTIRVKAKALKNGAKASLYPRLKIRGFRAKVEFDNWGLNFTLNSELAVDYGRTTDPSAFRSSAA